MGTAGNKLEVVDKKNLEEVWELVYELVKAVTGNVNIEDDGDLQSQIKSLDGKENRIRDDTADKEYKLGIDNGLVYIQEVDE